MSYVNLNNPANFQLQEFEQLGFRYIVSGRPTIGGETYRTIFVLTDAVVTATCPNGDSLSSETLVAGTVIHGFFEDVSVASGSLLAYKAGPITAQEIFDAYKAYVYAQGGIVEGESCAVAAIAALLEDKLYSAASLVLIPSGYKVSHLYAERPLDSNGDFTFTRASSATRVGPNGLIEKVRTNLALYSQDLSQTGTWFTSATTRVDSQTDPNGGTTASKFTATGANSNVIQTLTVSSGIPYTWSFYAKSDSATDVNIRLDNNNGNFVQANMALTTSWQRFSITLNSNATTILCFLGGGLSFATGEVAYMAFAQLESGDVMTDYIATTTAAVSVGPVANLPRIDYTGGGCGKLLLEPQRTNSITSSESTATGWTFTNSSSAVNQTTSPDGYVNADSIIPNATSGQHAINSTNITASGSFTLSAFVKAGEHTKVAIRESANTGSYASFNLATGTKIEDNVSGASFIQSYGNGWYRIGVTGTYSGTIRLGINVLSNAYTTGNPSSGTTFFSGNASDKLFCWGMQCELGATYATSYIGPTLGAAVTRLDDSCYKTGISSLIGATEGTMFVDINFTAKADNSPAYIQTWYSQGERLGLFYNFSADIIRPYLVTSSGSSDFSLGFTPTVGQRYKMAFAYKANDYSLFVNGTQVTIDARTSVPTAGTTIHIGCLEPTAQPNRQFSEINQALLFKTRLTNADLATLTTL